MITCPHCKTDLPLWKAGWLHGFRRYECQVCNKKFTDKSDPQDKTRELQKCLECGKETYNDLCSWSCVGKYNSRTYLKGKGKKYKPRYCRTCGRQIEKRQMYCKTCHPQYVDYNQRTIGDIQADAKYQISAKLRDVARRVYKTSRLPRICRRCGYDKHIEICHIRAINSFPPETPVAVVNHIDNLMALCPNCHWEFDHGLLSMDELAR